MTAKLAKLIVRSAMLASAAMLTVKLHHPAAPKLVYANYTYATLGRTYNKTRHH